MIFTVTYNPSLDYYVKVNTLKSGVVNRAVSEKFEIGGKGVNVSLALKELGNDSVALGFVSGFTGKAIRNRATELNLNHDFIEVEGQSRINVKIKSTVETDINGTGSEVHQKHVNKLINNLKKVLKEGDWLIISGNVPKTLSDSAYGDLLKRLKTIKGVNVVVDAYGNLLIETLKYKPFLIKPNIYELCEIFSLSYSPGTKEVAKCARKLQSMGARNVIVSMGSAGALMVTETEQTLYVRATQGQVINSVGAGDSMIAGFIHEYLSTDNYFSALNFAVAAGSACAFTSGLATREQIEYVESLML